jgi:hypothetical protein
MDLKTLLLSLEPSERQQFASEVGHSLGHLKNVMYGYKPCSAELAAAIERVSRARYGKHQTVKRWDLIPDGWWLIWPELTTVADAPFVGETEQRVA